MAQMENKQRLLVVGPSWVGDMVMAQSLFKLLKGQQAALSIDVLAPAWSEPLLARMPEVDGAIVSPFAHGQLRLRARRRLGHELRAHQYQQAIVLPNSYKSALVPFWANIPRRTGWLGEMRYGVLNDARRLDEKALPLMVQRFLALGLQPDQDLPEKEYWPALEISPQSVEDSLAQHHLQRPTQPLLALCPGAEFGPAKRWPVEYYAEVANAKLAEGWQVWLFGSANDRAVTDKIEALTDHRVINLAGRTQLAEAVDLLSLASLVVSNDSGLMHIAAALGRPLVVIYGASSPEFTPPLANRVQILNSDLSCSPCFERECPLGHLRCMKELKPDKVLAATLRGSGL